MKSFQPFRLDEVNQCLWRGDTRVQLTPKPFAVLRYLVEHHGRLVTHDELMAAVWPDTYVQPEVLRRYILEIRRVLGDQAGNPRFVETLPKRGYRFIAAVTESPDVLPAATSPPTTKLVGRQPALLQLHKYLANALDGQRQLVFVSGEAGIGKTSLVDTFHQQVENLPAVTVARGQSVEGFGGKEAYYPILEALGQLVRGPESERVADVLTKQAPTWLVQFPSLVDADQTTLLDKQILGASRERMVRELCEALEIITQEKALVIILEDLHWVDHSTVDLISAIARRREPAKLVVLGTYRPADLILHHSPFKSLKQDLVLHHLGFELLLERLAESDVSDYLNAEYSESDLPIELLSAVIHRHSDGNPLFMIAMLDHLALQGVLAPVDGRWRMTLPLQEVDPGVPETLREMLELQLQHLSSAEQQLLKCASVAGQHFTAWSVAIMMAADSTSVENMCAQLAERQQFLKARGARELSSGEITLEYEFRHSLYREVLYRRLSPTHRVTYHRRLGEGLEQLRPSIEGDSAAEIALHFEEGREYERAIRHLVLAAENATRRYAHRESIDTLQHALELIPRIDQQPGQELEVEILGKIGDSHYALGDMERSASTYHAMATRAAAAGLLTAQANALMHLAHSAEAIPFFLRAVELDPNFALAYVSLSRIYSNLGDGERARHFAELAYGRRENVSERDLFSILYQYHFEVTGDQTQASETLEKWKRVFPEEFQPVNSLALIHNVLGNFEQAVEEGIEAVRRNPQHGFPYSNLAHAYRGLGKYELARDTAERAVALNIATVPTCRLLYQLATLAGDHDAASRHVEWCRDKPRSFEITGAQAQVAAWSGKAAESRNLYEQTARMAEIRNLPNVAANYLASSVWMAIAFDDLEFALDQARRILARRPGYDPSLRAALALAANGAADEAEAIADEMVTARPEHTMINFILVPLVRASVALARGEPSRAIDHLRVVEPYELGFGAALAPLYLRAQAFLMQGSGEKAARELERILDHRGTDPFSPFCAIAPLGIARAEAISRNTRASVNAYEQFLAQWSDADPDIPVLLQARKETPSVGWTN